MASTEQITNEDCPICMESYKVPKILKCGHSLCNLCIVSWSQKGKLTCPECRSITEMSENGLITNLALISMSSTEQNASICCPICQKSYEKPKILKCGHSLCNLCIVSWAQKGKLTCPECRSITEMSENGLITNLALISMSSTEQNASECCVICRKSYEKPKILNCGHSFCERCIVSSLTQKGYISCPKCRKPTVIPEEGLTTNFALNHQLTDVSNITVVRSKMCASMEMTVKNIILKVKNNATNEVLSRKLAGMITKEMNGKYGKYWQCIIVEKKESPTVGIDIFPKTKHFIVVETAIDRICLFRAKEIECCWKCDHHLCEGNECNLTKPRIFYQQGQMRDKQMVEDAKEMSIRAIKENEDHYGIAEAIKEFFDNKYGGRWICNVGCVEKSASCFDFATGFFLGMDIGMLRIEIFKPC